MNRNFVAALAALAALSGSIASNAETAPATMAAADPRTPSACVSGTQAVNSANNAPPAFDVERVTECDGMSVRITLKPLSAADLEGMGYVPFFLQVGLCSSPEVREEMRQGWRYSIQVVWRGATPVSMAVDCTGYDRMTGGKNPPPPGTPEALAEGQPAPVEPSGRPVIDFRLGEPFIEARLRSSMRMDERRPFFTDEKVDLVFRYGDESLQLPRVGGTGHSVLSIDLDQAEKVKFVTFHYQDRPLKLEEAIERARGLETWLFAQGFQAQAAAKSQVEFHVLEPNSAQGERASDWTAAQAALADETRGIARMHLFTLAAPGAVATVDIENWRRSARDFGLRGKRSDSPFAGRTIFDGNGGYEWGLAVTLRAPYESEESTDGDALAQELEPPTPR